MLGARSSRECRSQFPLRHYLQQPNHFVERSNLIGNASRYTKTARQLTELVRGEPDAFTDEQRRELAWAIVEADMLQHLVSRRLSDRLGGIEHGPQGSIDKLLNTWVEQAVGHAAVDIAGCAHDGGDPTMLNTYLYSRAQSVMGGTSQIQKNLIASRILGLPSA